MKKFNLVNNIFGWVAFAIAAITYLLSMEPTASFWDCPEFIACGNKLEIGHPPGAPFFMLIQRFFSLFAKDVQHIAVCVNSWSAISSALTILFLFWTITRLARKVITPENGSEYSLSQTISIIGAGFVGAVLYAFTDSFWFSAVEAEVYASSALFTAVVFWAILKWEDEADEPYGNRWLILIAYLMGLSIGVHLLNLLTIPALILVYYFKKYNATAKGTIIALIVSFIVLGVVDFALVPGVLTVAAIFELLFVNKFGFFINSGLVFYCFLLVSSLIWGIYESYTAKSNLRIKISFILAIALTGIPFFNENIFIGIIVLIGLIVAFRYIKEINPTTINTILLGITVVIIGYSSYGVVIIRSNANTPLNENAPGNVFALKSYLSRDQYGDSPLLYGQYYNAEIKRYKDGEYCKPVIKEGKTIWGIKEKANPNDKDKYIEIGKKQDYVYEDEFCTIFPRMWSSQPSHVSQYQSWAKIEGKQVEYTICDQPNSAIVPTFGENLTFFFKYQVGNMYLRYFFWNFVGRQNDVQNFGDIQNGNFITGIKFLDEFMLGSQVDLPKEQVNKGTNVYYLLPFILGIIGLVWQLNRGKKGLEGFWITGILFFMTGLAIVLYLNQTPLQPRERDYAYAGSFYAFAIWVGLGVFGVANLLEKLFKHKLAASITAALLCALVPLQMLSQNWDDHNRANRFTCRDFAWNYLMSLAPNAIVFTNGDNDTFPLWYLQEVEGVRRDVRVCNLSYLQTDWYIDQMRRAAYESAPLPIKWKHSEYVQGMRDVSVVEDHLASLDAKSAIHEFVLNPDIMDQDGVGKFPTHNLYIPINKDQVVNTGTVKPEQKDSIVPQFNIKLKDRIYKHEMMILEMLSQNDWKRPIYFAVTVGDDYYMGLDDYFRLEGLAYRIVPVGTKGQGGSVATDIMYDNMMNKFRWGNIQDPKVYIDETNMRMCKTFRFMFYRLADALIKENKMDKAEKVLDRCTKVIPSNTVPNDYYSVMIATQYYALKKYDKGDAIMDDLASNCTRNIRWFRSLSDPRFVESINKDLNQNLGILKAVLEQCQLAGRTKIVNKYVEILNTLSR